MSIENVMKRYEDQKPDILSRKEESLVARVEGPDGSPRIIRVYHKEMQITDVNIDTKKATDTQLVSTSMSVTYFEENLNYVPEADMASEDGTDAQSADGSTDGSGQGLAGM